MTKIKPVQEVTKTISIYVDGQSIFKSTWLLGPKYGLHSAKPDYEAIMNEAINAGCDALGVEEVDIEEAVVYSSARHTAKKFQAALKNAGFDCKIHVLRQRGTCGVCGSQKDHFSWRTQIVADAIEALHRGALVRDLDHCTIVVSASPEMKALTDVIQGYNMKVVSMGFPGRLSDKLPNHRFLTEKCMYGEELRTNVPTGPKVFKRGSNNG